MSTAIRESMSVPLGALPGDWSLADLQSHLGGISLERIRMFPPPGYATEEDVESIEAHEDRLFELEDGILVEKTMGWYESLLAALISTELNLYLAQHDLGKVLGADGALRILPGIVKIPDVSFNCRCESYSRKQTGRHRKPRSREITTVCAEICL